jgi:hypothetical protein
MTRVAKKYIDEMVESYAFNLGDSAYWERYMCITATVVMRNTRKGSTFHKVLEDHGVAYNGSLNYKPAGMLEFVPFTLLTFSRERVDIKNETRLNFLLLLQASGLH